MSMRRSLRAGIVLAGVAAASLTGGAAYASMTSITATATDTIAAHTSGGVFLSSTGGVNTPIVSMSLPQGHYVISANGNLVNFGPSDYTRCSIVVNGVQIAATSTVVGDSNQSGNVGPSDLLSTVALTGGVKVGSAGATATLQCEHDYTNGAAPYFDNAGDMWAHRTSSLSVQSF